MDRCGHLTEDDEGQVVSIRGHWYELCADCAAALEDIADKQVGISKREALTE